MEQDESRGTIRSAIAIGPRNGMYVDSHNTFCSIEANINVHSKKYHDYLTIAPFYA